MLDWTVFGVLMLVVPSLSRELRGNIYNSYTNRKLGVVIKSLPTSSDLKCTSLCSKTDGCLAVNVIGDHDITCELTTGLSNETELLIDPGSKVFVLDYNRCAEEPGFCKNGATCESVWTSARCHCTDGYYGNRCDVRFRPYYHADCNHNQNIDVLPDTDLEACKIWCGDSERCGGFTVNLGKCWFKDTTYDQNIISRPSTLFLK